MEVYKSNPLYAPKCFPQIWIVGDLMAVNIVKVGEKNYRYFCYYYSAFTAKWYRTRACTYRYKQSAVRYAMNHVR
jgi:hypothetical protein